MTPFSFALVGLRLLAIYAFVQSVPLFASFGVLNALNSPQELFGWSRVAFVVMTLAPGSLLLFTAVLVYVISGPLARRMAPTEAVGPKEGGYSVEQIQSIAFPFAGILVLTFVLPTAFRAIHSVFQVAQSKHAGFGVSSFQFNDVLLTLAGVLLQVVIGLLLVVNPKGTRNLWRWLRTAGT